VLQLIEPDNYGQFIDDLEAVHRLRYRVFKQRLGWEVETTGNMEVDSFDALRPNYLLLRDGKGAAIGCVRLLPTTGPYMPRDTFPALLGELAAPASNSVWESSRFALDVAPELSAASKSISSYTFELFAGMVEFGLAKGLAKIVTVTDVRMERILRRAGWPLERISAPREIGKTQAVAGFLPVSVDILHSLKEAGSLKGPVVWAPIVRVA
jgi:N-acyl-L-homoserine lactone synthetase